MIEEAEANIRALMHIPEGYEVMFLQGGATTHFAAIAMNFAVCYPWVYFSMSVCIYI